MKTIDSKGLFKACGDIMIAESDITDVISDEIYLEGTISSGRGNVYATIGLELGRIYDNIPTQDGMLNISFWSRVSSASSDTTIRSLGDKAIDLFHGDEGVERINDQAVEKVRLRHSECINAVMFPPDSNDYKRYSVAFMIKLSKSYL